MGFKEGGRQHGFENWRVLNLETRKIFCKAVDGIRASTFSNGFDPISLRVAEYASSCNIKLVGEGGALTVTELQRRFGFIFLGSVVQALVADGAEVDCDDEKVSELRIPKNNKYIHSKLFSVSFWFVIGVFDVSSFCPDASHPSGHSTRTSYAIVLPCLREHV